MELSCRCCLTSVENKLLPLSMIKNGQTLSEIVIFLCGVDINEHDCLPQKICEDCIKQISDACEVKQKVVNTDNLLREKFKEEISTDQLKVEATDFGASETEHQFTMRMMEQFSDPVGEDTKSFHFKDCDEENSNTMEVDFTSAKFSENIRRALKSSSISKQSRREKMMKDLNCTLCDRTFQHQKSFEKHLKKHRSEANEPQKIVKKNKTPEDHDYKCHICLLKFDLITHKNNHVKKDHVEEKICRICKKKCKTPISLEVHIKFHFQDYQFMCHLCAKNFRYKNRLEHHMKLNHSNDVEIICDICGLTSKFKNNIKRHMKTVHQKLKNYKCTECKELYEYSTQEALNSHNYRYHGLEAPIKCPDCNLGFTFESELRAHKKHMYCSNNLFAPIVKREKSNPEFLEVLENGKFFCKICRDTFDTKNKWSMHNYLKHKYSNKCETCDMQLTNYTSLIRHIKVKHNHIKPFKCEFCDKTFGQKVSMISHRNTHTGEKSFACAFCTFKSGDHGTVSKHKKKMHPEQMLK